MWIEIANIQSQTLSDEDYKILFVNDTNPFVYYDAKYWSATNSFYIDSILYSNIRKDLSEDTLTLERQFYLNSNKPFISDIKLDNDKYTFPDYAIVQQIIYQLKKHRR